MEHRLEVADVFRQHQQEFLARWGHTLSSHQRKAFRDICACRTAALGTRLQQCDHCSHQDLVFNSCRHRACPKCQSRARDQWLATTAQELLPVPYSHVTFTLPHQLSLLALQNPRRVYNILFQAVSETLLTLAADPRRIGAQIGFLAVLHTWGQNLMHHPHLHCVVPSGGLSADGTAWVAGRPSFFLPVRVLSRVFRGKFLDLLKGSLTRGELKFYGALRSLNEAATLQRLLRDSVKHEWVVYAKPPFGGPEQVLKYLARYTHRVAISNSRLLHLEDGRVTFRWKDYAGGGRQRTMTLDATEFIRRFLLHVLPTGFVRIRYYGFMANRHRARHLARCRQLLGQPETPEPQDRSADDAALSGPDDAPAPSCPLCHQGRMRIIEQIAPGFSGSSTIDVATHGDTS